MRLRRVRLLLPVTTRMYISISIYAYVYLRHVAKSRAEPLEVQAADIGAVEQNAIYMHMHIPMYKSSKLYTTPLGLTRV